MNITEADDLKNSPIDLEILDKIPQVTKPVFYILLMTAGAISMGAGADYFVQVAKGQRFQRFFILYFFSVVSG